MASELDDVSSLAEGASLEVSLSGAFSDADGDALTITASSDYETVVTVAVASDGSSLTLTGVSSGEATITVVAQDPDGNQASQSFDVEVTDSAPQQQSEPVEQEPPTPTPTPTPTPGLTLIVQPAAVDLASVIPEVVDRYDTNDDGKIDKSERDRAANDHFNGIITHADMVAVQLAYEASSG